MFAVFCNGNQITEPYEHSWLAGARMNEIGGTELTAEGVRRAKSGWEIREVQPAPDPWPDGSRHANAHDRAALWLLGISAVAIAAIVLLTGGS